MENRRNPCEECVYYVRCGHGMICDYLLRTGRRRPCKFGAGCTVKTTEGGRNLKDWDKAMAKKLWEEGESDYKIAKAVGVSASSVSLWRRKNGLAATGEYPPVPSPPTPEQDDPPDAPPAAGPVELHLEIKGGWARLRAPSWEQAAELWRKLNVCVGALAGEKSDG